jgi:hypothetical protein
MQYFPASDTLVVFGGVASDGYSLSSNVYSLNLKTLNWTARPSSVEARREAASAIAGDTLMLVYGGQTSNDGTVYGTMSDLGDLWVWVCE